VESVVKVSYKKKVKNLSRGTSLRKGAKKKKFRKRKRGLEHPVVGVSGGCRQKIGKNFGEGRGRAAPQRVSTRYSKNEKVGSATFTRWQKREDPLGRPKFKGQQRGGWHCPFGKGKDTARAGAG